MRSLQQQTRAGITLLEVLISIGVVSVGLLSLAALIPVGQHQANVALKSDRISALGRATFRDVQVRGFMDQTQWYDHFDTPGYPEMAWDYDRKQGANLTPTISVTAPTVMPQEQWIPAMAGAANGSPIDWGNTVCIDPVFLSRAAWLNGGSLALNWPGRKFPYELDNDPDPSGPLHTVPISTDWPTAFQNFPNPPRMQRLNLNLAPAAPAATFLQARYAMAERIFGCQDDLLFDLPDDPTLRPLASPLMSSGTAGVPIRQQNIGDYSWMFTVGPGPSESFRPGAQIRNLTVTTILFHKRPILPAAWLTDPGDADRWRKKNSGFALADRPGLPPGERMMWCDFLSQVGWGGGSVRLRLPATTGANDKGGVPTQSDVPAIKPGQWIMLCNWVKDYELYQRASSNTNEWPYQPVDSTSDLEFPFRAIFRWYKVLSVGTTNPLTGTTTPGPVFNSNLNVNGTLTGPTWYIDLTIAGPDWTETRPNMPDADSVTPPTLTAPGTDVGFPGTVWATVVEGVVGVYEKTITLNPQ